MPACMCYFYSVAAALGGLAKPRGASVLCLPLYAATWFFSLGLILGWSLAKNNSPARKAQERGPGSSNLTVLISLKQQKNKYTLFSLCNREEILPPATSGKT